MKKSPLRTIRYFAEYAFLGLMMRIFMILGPDRAPAFGGWVGRVTGHLTGGANRTAQRHLTHALPGHTQDTYDRIILGMWDNLGRVLAEFPNLPHYAAKAQIVGTEHVDAALSKYGRMIFFSGHIGNWEIAAASLLNRDMPVNVVYRAPNNPFVARMLDHYRGLGGQVGLLPKSQSGTRRLVEAVRHGGMIGILIDQKYNPGIEMPFFGYPAMTSPAFVQLAQKYHCPLIPFRSERLADKTLRLTFFPPLPTADATGRPRPVEDVITDAHRILEEWIADRPEQWLWLHKRWKKAAFNT